MNLFNLQYVQDLVQNFEKKHADKSRKRGKPFKNY